tara:strand:- start:4835 stop:5578 length:744 start_codon:yes stop_codon:yes gene_type:complete
MKKYFICKSTFDASTLRSFEPINNILDWNCFSVDEGEVAALPGYAVEVGKEMAIFGTRGWGDIRSTIKISAADAALNSEFDNLSYTDFATSAKVAIPMTETRYNTVMRTMKLFAKVIIEDTFNKRFEALDEGVSSLEKKNWEYLVSDIDNDTDFILSDLADAKGVSVDQLKTSVSEKRSFYKTASKDLFVAMNSLKKEFYNCTTIRQLNRLYEDKMGIPMPYEQAKEESRIDEKTKSQLPVAPGIKF